MESIRRASVPEYLRTGTFFQNLDKQDESEFEIPKKCYKEDCHIETIQDLVLLLNTVRFWGLNEPPIEVFQFMVKNGCAADYHELRNSFPEFGRYMDNVLAVKKVDRFKRISEALKRMMGIDAVFWLHQHGSILTAEASAWAASMDDYASLMYLYLHLCPWDERTTTAAATTRNVDCLLFAMQSKCPVSNKLINEIARMGYIDVLQVLHNEGIPLNETTLIAAIQGQNFDCVRFLHTQGCSITKGACTEVVNTHPTPATLEILKYLHEQEAEWDVYTFQHAAWHGNLPCLVYLHTHGCPWDAYGIALASGKGHLSCLVYLHAEGCPWDERTVNYALSAGHGRCALYAITHGYVCHQFSGVLSRYGVGALACLVVYIMPDPWYYAAQVSIAILGRIQEGHYTYQRVCQLWESWLCDVYGTWPIAILYWGKPQLLGTLHIVSCSTCTLFGRIGSDSLKVIKQITKTVYALLYSLN